MTTIGYGDITPKTINEKFFVIIISFLACGVFAYAIVKKKKIFFIKFKIFYFLFLNLKKNFIGTIVGEMSKKVLE
jgi:hypothetical protein